MKINTTKKIGMSTLTFQTEGDKEVDALATAAIFTSMPDTCTLCKSTDVELSSNKANGFTFVKVKCLKCNGRSNLGQYKDGGAFWKEFTVYEKPETVKESGYEKS